MHTCPKGHPSYDADYCDECGTPMAATISVRPVTLAASPSAAPTQACPQCGTGKVGRFCEVCGHDFLLAGIAPTTFRPGAGQSAGAAPTATPATGATPAGGTALADGMSPAGWTSLAGGAAATVDAPGVAPGAVEPVQGRAAAGAGDASMLVAWADGSVVAGSGVGVTAAGVGAAPATATPDGSAGPREWRLVATPDPAYHAMMQANAEPGSTPIPFPTYCPERRFTLSGRQILIGRRSRTRGIEPEVDLSGPPADPAVSHTHALLLFQPATGWAVVDLESANGTYLNDNPDPIAANIPITLTDGDRIHVGAWTTLTVYTA